MAGRSSAPRRRSAGVVLGALASAAGAPPIGLEPEIGALVGGLAMAGDLLSSFVKRRVDMPPSGRASGLDQIQESLLPLLACGNSLSLTIADIVVGVLLFSI